MIFWLFVILIAIGGVVLYFSNEYYLDLEILFVPCFMAGFIGLIVSAVFLISNHSNVSGQVRSQQERYDLLVYQLENDIYDNDNDLGKRELYKDIQEWNEDLAWYQEAQDSFWLGIYIPNVFDEFEFIELK